MATCMIAGMATRNTVCQVSEIPTFAAQQHQADLQGPAVGVQKFAQDNFAPPAARAQHQVEATVRLPRRRATDC